MEIMEIDPKYLNLIKEGKKKIEFRSWLTDSKIIKLVNNKTKQPEAIITIMEVIDTIDFPEEEKEEALIENGVDLEFAENYDCRYAYLIEEVHIVH